MCVKFSIITVCYNAEKYIRSTILSVLQQEYKNYQYIIKDGKSSDSTMEIVHELLDGNDRVKIISERDSGIYDAMNEAAEFAEGEYVLFLNAGDSFCDGTVLKKTDEFLKKNIADVLYGNIIQIDGSKKNIRKYGPIYKKKIFYLTGDSICHQALFVKRELLKRKFDTSYQVCADREWQLYWLSKKAKFVSAPFEVSKVLVDGFSREHIQEYEEEARRCIHIYLRKAEWLYCIVEWMKKKKVLLTFFQNIEKIFWKA